MNKIASGIMMLLLLVGPLGLVLNTRPVEAASETIYINPDGSISSPVPANITTSDKVTYTFNGSNYLPIIVNRSNIIINGMGHTLQAPGGHGFTFQVNNITVKNTTIRNSYMGFDLLSSNCTVSGNNITNNNYGIWLYNSLNNVVSRNIIRNNTDGIALIYSSGNSILSNNITANNQYGIELFSSLNNTVCHNNFISNTLQVYLCHCSYFNSWDNGYPSGGNYWSDYNGTDSDGDGIGDSPYVIDANDQDNYPLIYPYIAGDCNHDGIVNILDGSLIGWYWEQTVPPAPKNADINNDGTINTQDAQIIMDNWLQHA